MSSHQTIDSSLEDNSIKTELINRSSDKNKDQMKRQKSQIEKLEDNYQKDCFSDRFCDDLTEELLQYLSLKDKLRLECVSKQFRRNIFNKHYILIFERESVYKKLLSHSVDYMSKLTKFINKLVNLKGIVIKFNVKKEVLILIIENCNYLTKFDLSEVSLDSNVVNLVFEKYGTLLISLTDKRINLSQFWTGISNIEELVVNRIPDLSVVQFNGLKRIKVCNLFEENIDIFESFIKTNRNSLKELSINCMHLSDEDLIKFWEIISNIKNLIDLEIISFLELNEKKFSYLIKQLSLNCKHLKSLKIFYVLTDDSNQINLSSLQKLKQLKRLDVFFLFDGQTYQEIKEIIEKMSFKNFIDLTHLTLRFQEFDEPISDVILKDIDICLPKLQSLKIKDIKIEATEYTTDILSKLSELHSIELRVTKESTKQEIQTKLIENCKRITIIDITSEELIDLQFFESLFDD